LKAKHLKSLLQLRRKASERTLNKPENFANAQHCLKFDGQQRGRAKKRKKEMAFILVKAICKDY
jgi:hypothetical protein